MNTPAKTPTPTPDDEPLRQHLKATLADAAPPSLGALQSRSLEQWRQRVAAQPRHTPGPLAVLQSGWRQHPALWSGTALALVLAALLVFKPWVQPDPGLDELMQPDVLSLMAAGEL